MIGIDIGANFTKGVVLEQSEIVKAAIEPTMNESQTSSRVLESLMKTIQEKERAKIKILALTGGGSRKIGNFLGGFSARKVDEIKAIGIGGLLLSKKNKCLVVNAGTGTAMVAAYDKGKSIVHVGGTGVGGGTALGLSWRMFGISEFEIIEKMAFEGNPNEVNLTVADIVGGSIGIIPSEATASNFGKLTDGVSNSDLAAGIFNLVCQVIGVLASMTAKAYQLEEDVVFAGGFLRSRMVSENLLKIVELFGCEAATPENPEYCTAVGAAFLLESYGKSAAD